MDTINKLLVMAVEKRTALYDKTKTIIQTEYLLINNGMKLDKN